MSINEVDKGVWARYLPPQITPKALKIYTRLTLEESKDYEKIN